jgi:asparagine synthase (glutamine-hydrolysing)
MKTTVAVLDKEGNNVVERVLDVLNTLSGRQPSHFGLISPKKTVIEKSPGILSRQGIESSTAVGYVSSKSATSSSYEFLQMDDAALIFEGRIYSPIPKNTILEEVKKKPLHCESILQTLMANADGDYAFSLVKDGSIGAGRDPVGVQPLYYAENRNVAAFATNRKALWLLGLENPLSFPPGNIGFLNREGFQFKPVKTLTFAEPESITLDDAAIRLQVLLEESIRRRTNGLKGVAVAFSGGLDSSIVAFIASKLGLKVNLFHVSMENQPETEEAIEASEKLNLPLQVDLFKDSDLENTLPQVVALIEEADPIKASIGLPFYWVAEKASETRFQVILAGQGADELFGGYQRYVKEYCKAGAEKVRKTMFDDVANIFESNLERDLKITSHFDIELRLPFASFNVVEFALTLPIECKMEPKEDTLRKLVLRRMALNIGLPSVLVDKPKKAVQYSTGINDAIKRVAKKQDKTVNEYITGLLQESKS